MKLYENDEFRNLEVTSVINWNNCLHAVIYMLNVSECIGLNGFIYYTKTIKDSDLMKVTGNNE